MSALNVSETDALRRVVSTLEIVLKEGYSPTATDQRNVGIGKALNSARDQTRTIVTMKGHYSK